LHNDHTESAADVRVAVPLARIADGWPPFACEILKVVDQGNGYRIDCIPWFTYGLNRNDVISATVQNGALIFQDVIERSGHCTFRIRLHLHSIPEPERVGAFAELTALAEALGRFDVLFASSSDVLHSIDVPPNPTSNIRAVVTDLLKVFEDREWFEWEEGTFPVQRAAGAPP
jgi:hypothetical protein